MNPTHRFVLSIVGGDRSVRHFASEPITEADAHERLAKARQFPKMDVTPRVFTEAAYQQFLADQKPARR